MLDPKPIMALLEKASLFELNQLSMMIEQAMQQSDRIKSVREQFRVGDVIPWFDPKRHQCYPGRILEKHYKYLLLQDVEHPQYQYKIPYGYLNLNAHL